MSHLETENRDTTRFQKYSVRALDFVGALSNTETAFLIVGLQKCVIGLHCEERTFLLGD